MSAWEIFVQLLPILAAIGGTAALLSWRQNHNASLRSAWWDRTSWAVSQVNAVGEHQTRMGLDVIQAISSSGMTPKRDIEIFEAVFRWSYVHLEYLNDDSSTEFDDNGTQDGGQSHDRTN